MCRWGLLLWGIIMLATTEAMSQSLAAAPAPCPDRTRTETLVLEHLPILKLTSDESKPDDSCHDLASADFNHDGDIDYAAVLTETRPLRNHGDGTPVRSAYITVFLSQPTPYANFQAIILLGYDAPPDRYKLYAAPSKGPADLVVEREGYSISRLRWNGRGFEVKHQAD